MDKSSDPNTYPSLESLRDAIAFLCQESKRMNELAVHALLLEALCEIGRVKDGNRSLQTDLQPDVKAPRETAAAFTPNGH